MDALGTNADQLKGVLSALAPEGFDDFARGDLYKSALDLSDMSDAMNDQTADRWSLGMWPTSSPAPVAHRYAATGA